MGEVLYRKYRSRSLDEIVGQDHITTTLKNALKAGKIAHAYLFTGPKGVGKTSIARILAYEINDIPYDDKGTHLDIIEIDAASNRRIDEIRELRDKVHVAPTSAKYKVYIIDEVHMLTKEAFNALLKTLEEPPAHVVFILATTEAHKLPETIISRTQRFTFKPIDDARAIDHLKSLAKKEKIAIDDEALQLIVEHAAGSFRDSISLLDQVSGVGGDVTADTIRHTIGVPPKESISELKTAIENQNTAAALDTITSLYGSGFHAPQIAKELSKSFRKDVPLQKRIIKMLHKLLRVPASYDPSVYLQLVILETCMPQVVGAGVPPESSQSQPEAPKAEVKPAKEEPAKTAPSPATTQKVSKSDVWTATLTELRGRHNTLYGIARMAQATVNGDTLTLAFAFPFHQKRLDEQRNKERLHAVVQDVTGQSFTIECVVDKSAKPADPETMEPASKPPTVSAAPSATLDSITEVFGGGQVLD